ncbi:CDP-diacylglycerol--glycerol-3-phosphate 3-phosphatidyltransferase [Candidatus Endobugula sertula]|uniref:CDP-diacylglycerol--glycerol-3-phosphate 3-phosphatidyltransferase n=1 Tax=Candidatus Endobugula sertula TaxID=62101 RepID=A0A1D2QR69_9GAMM|nr:CDP-diacylglycerol--glycerol-3-phosphate 3-phosphatidyltransferase [Candidatus Endobugula sertula]
MNVANQLTLLRILLIPLIVAVFYLPYDWRYPLASGMFCLAAITDWFDGWVARKFNQITHFGAFLDPVADKLMVVVALVLLVEVHATPIIVIPAIVIIGREIVISALREWMAELGKRASIAVSVIGKFKTFAQMFAITLLLFDNPQEPTLLNIIGYVLLYIAALLTLWSMVVYMQVAWQDLMRGHRNRE